MTAFVNIRMTSETVMIDPHLKVLVDRLIMLNPKLVFSQAKAVSEFEYDVSFNWSKQKEKHSAPAGFKYVRLMSVYEDSEKVGMIGVDQESKSDTGFIYTVSNWRIDKSRGRRNTTTTKKIDVAVRECKKTFKKRNILELYEKGEEDAVSACNRAIRDLCNPISNSQIIRNSTGMQLVGYCLANKVPFDNKELTDIFDKLKSQEYGEAVDKYFLAKDIHNTLNKMAVVDVGGRFAYKTMVEGEPDVQLVTKEYEELSQSMQDKIAVLQLMQDNEMVKDVGFRAKAGVFVILQ
jgi:hypothetical protein